ncbi:MAG TPA: hypothetical protein VI548_03170 [Chitinophagaceae bacterium]|nr:hypothetical protein [Chitinophagaceae bacterium]
MRWLLFLSRVAFICNLLFLISFSLLLTQWLKNEGASSTIIIVGYTLSIIFNPVVNLIYLVLFWVKKSSLSVVPAWLMVLNILFLMLQLVYLLLLNVSNY